MRFSGVGECLLLREERRSGLRGPISVFDPQRSSASNSCCSSENRVEPLSKHSFESIRCALRSHGGGYEADLVAYRLGGLEIDHQLEYPACAALPMPPLWRSHDRHRGIRARLRAEVNLPSMKPRYKVRRAGWWPPPCDHGFARGSALACGCGGKSCGCVKQPNSSASAEDGFARKSPR